MGQPKLLLPWQDGTVIDSVLKAWTSSQVTHVIVVCRKDDAELIAACRKWPVEVVLPEEDPPDMKCSIQNGIDRIRESMSPTENDHWMIAPADLPTLKTKVIDRVIDERNTTNIVVPRFDGHASHPVLLPWSLSPELSLLKASEGLKSLIERHPKRFVEFEKAAYAPDMDAPEDYERLVNKPTS